MMILPGLVLAVIAFGTLAFCILAEAISRGYWKEGLIVAIAVVVIGVASARQS